MPKTQKSGQSCQLTANVFQEYLKEEGEVEEGNFFIVCLLRFLTLLLYWLYGLCRNLCIATASSRAQENVANIKLNDKTPHLDNFNVI